jgi:flagellar motility protein MotE (MotC chaperone)
MKMTFMFYKKAAVGITTALLITSAMTRLVSANLAGSEEPTDARGDVNERTLEGVEIILTDLERREANVESREKLLNSREDQLKTLEEKIKESLSELQNSQNELESLMFSSSSAAETDITNLTRIYESMKPKEAASLFENMDHEFAAGFLARMPPESAAQILSNLSPTSAYAISATIAGRNTNAATE